MKYFTKSFLYNHHGSKSLIAQCTGLAYLYIKLLFQILRLILIWLVKEFKDQGLLNFSRVRKQYLSITDYDFPEWYRHLEMLTNQLKIFVKLKNPMPLFSILYMYVFIYVMPPICYLKCLRTWIMFCSVLGTFPVFIFVKTCNKINKLVHSHTFFYLICNSLGK